MTASWVGCAASLGMAGVGNGRASCEDLQAGGVGGGEAVEAVGATVDEAAGVGEVVGLLRWPRG
ncbi:MAG TPA: hypothetical protein VII58_10190 [Acidobacteriaceae bacterium]